MYRPINNANFQGKNCSLTFITFPILDFFPPFLGEFISKTFLSFLNSWSFTYYYGSRTSNHFNESFNIIFMETIKAVKKLIFFFYKNVLKIFSKLMSVSVDFSLIILVLGNIAWEGKKKSIFITYLLFFGESFNL